MRSVVGEDSCKLFPRLTVSGRFYLSFLNIAILVSAHPHDHPRFPGRQASNLFSSILQRFSSDFFFTSLPSFSHFIPPCGEGLRRAVFIDPSASFPETGLKFLELFLCFFLLVTGSQMVLLLFPRSGRR